jgi:phospholipase/carboxylesterase
MLATMWSGMNCAPRNVVILVAALLFFSCRNVAGPDRDGAAHLVARPVMAIRTVQPGERRIGGASGRGALLFVPQSAMSKKTVPLMVMLHGAGGSAEGVRFTFAEAARIGVVVLAPESRAQTWDVIVGAFGPDVAFINTALQETFDTVSVDTAHVAIGGFSDGASYALSLGLANGSLFTHVIAFSPGFNAAPAHEGAPRVFISHGTADTVLPIDRTSRRIVPQLRKEGYDVTYQEFEGPHAVPPAIAAQAFDWFS